jgi:hypothetical protein
MKPRSPVACVRRGVVRAAGWYAIVSWVAIAGDPGYRADPDRSD